MDRNVPPVFVSKYSTRVSIIKSMEFSINTMCPDVHKVMLACLKVFHGIAGGIRVLCSFFFKPKQPNQNIT